MTASRVSAQPAIWRGPSDSRTAGAVVLLPDLVRAAETHGVGVRPIAEGPVGREVFLLTRRSTTPTVNAVAEALRTAAGGDAA